MTFQLEIDDVKDLLAKNAYPPNIVDKEIKMFIDKIHNKNVQDTESINGTYMKLPYIGKFSKFAQKTIKYLCETFCKETNVRLGKGASTIDFHFF